MEGLYITLQTLLAIFGGIAVIGTGVNWIIKIFSPFNELKSQVELHERNLAKDKEAIDAMTSLLDKIERQNGIMSWAILEMLNHMITGNDIDELERRRNEMLAHLTSAEK